MPARGRRDQAMQYTLDAVISEAAVRQYQCCDLRVILPERLAKDRLDLVLLVKELIFEVQRVHIRIAEEVNNHWVESLILLLARLEVVFVAYHVSQLVFKLMIDALHIVLELQRSRA